MLQDFVCSKTVKELKSKKFDWDILPKVGGIYLVIYKSLNKPNFLVPTGTGGWVSRRNPNVTREKLNEDWLDFNNKEDRILYIGKATGKSIRESLKERIKSLIKFGDKKPALHWEGRYIWQLVDSDNLEIYWKEVENPKSEEKKLLLEFKNSHDQKLPFANLDA